jgi:competence protein ComEC
MPLLWLSLAFLTGVLLGDILALTTTTWLILSGVSLVIAVIQLVLKRRRGQTGSLRKNLLPFLINFPVPILLYVLCLGGLRYQAELPDLNDPTFVAAYNDEDQEMVVTGVVAAMPDMRDSFTYLRVDAKRMHPAKSLDYIEVHGLILARIEPGKAFHYGDRVLVRGELQTPPQDEAFSYRDYLARKGIYTLVQAAEVSRLQASQGNWFLEWINHLREKALAVTYRLWPDPEASLFSGILLGVESGIPEPVEEAFNETGTSHIIAISGFNIAILSGLFIRLFGRLFGPYRGALVALAAISIYTLLVGAQASVVRAAIMGGLSLGAGLVGRRQFGWHALALTVAAMAAFDPHVLWDVGFQLSFTATLGLVLYAEPLEKAFRRLASHWTSEERAKTLSGPVGEFFLFTFAAQVTTLPLIAYYFGRVSWISFLANPVILPVQPPIMIVGGISLVLGLLWFPLGKILAYAAWPFMVFTIRAVEFFAGLPGGSLALGKVSLLWLVLFYILLLGITFGWQKLKAWATVEPGRWQAAVLLPAIVLLGMLAVGTYRSVMAAPDGKLRLTLLEVGTGDAVLIQTPGGRYVLVNGGPSNSALADGLGRRFPPLQRRLDWLVVASPRSEQIAALPRLVERCPPTNVLWAGLPSASRQADYLREALKAGDIPIHSAEPGQVLNLGQGATLQVLSAGPRGAVLLLAWEHFRALLPLGLSDGDLESWRMGADIGQVTLLLLAENGYAPANPPTWIENLNPRLVLLSVAPDDRDGLPGAETLAALEGYTLLRTDENGWIEIATDGQQMWLELERVFDD